VAELFRVQTRIVGLDPILRDLGRKADDASPIMAIIAEDLAAAVSDRYESEGDGEWPPLADATLRLRRAGGAKILQDSGILAGSTQPSHGPDFAEATTDVDYIKFHLDGGEKIPKRNPFEIDERIFDEAEAQLLEWLVG